jgi:hypothetical protein
MNFLVVGPVVSSSVDFSAARAFDYEYNSGAGAAAAVKKRSTRYTAAYEGAKT